MAYSELPKKYPILGNPEIHLKVLECPIKFTHWAAINRFNDTSIKFRKFICIYISILYFHFVFIFCINIDIILNECISFVFSSGVPNLSFQVMFLLLHFTGIDDSIVICFLVFVCAVVFCSSGNLCFLLHSTERWMTFIDNLFLGMLNISNHIGDNVEFTLIKSH